MMTWREKTLARILLLLARMLADEPELKADLKHLANHIHVSPDDSMPRKDG